MPVQTDTPKIEEGVPDYEDLLYERMSVDETHPQTSYTYPYLTSTFSRYWELYTPNSNTDHRSWKSFQHYKRIVGPKNSGQDVVYTNAGGNYPFWFFAKPSSSYFGYNDVYGNCGELNKSLPQFLVYSDSGFVPQTPELETLRQRALNAMLPGIKPDLSLINSFIELKDFKSLPKTLRTIASLPAKLYASRKTLRATLRAGADGYLQLKFNLMPLLADISGIYTALNKLERRVNDLLTREGRPQRRHFTSSGVEFPNSDEVSAFYGLELFVKPIPQTQIQFTRQVFHEPTVFHAEVEYNYNYTQYQRQHAALLSLLDSFGVNFNPSIIWNAIPWSFVVDWVLGVSRYLGQFKVSNMEPQLNIRNFLTSVKRKRTIFVTRQTFSRGLDTPLHINGSKNVLPSVTETSYRRDCGMPSISSIVLSGLNLNEFSLGAALVLSQRRRHKRR